MKRADAAGNCGKHGSRKNNSDNRDDGTGFILL